MFEFCIFFDSINFHTIFLFIDQKEKNHHFHFKYYHCKALFPVITFISFQPLEEVKANRNHTQLFRVSNWIELKSMFEKPNFGFEKSQNVENFWRKESHCSVINITRVINWVHVLFGENVFFWTKFNVLIDQSIRIRTISLKFWFYQLKMGCSCSSMTRFHWAKTKNWNRNRNLKWISARAGFIRY